MSCLDRFAEAADLAESLIALDAPAGRELCNQDMPFDSAFLAAEVHAATAAAPRMAAAAAHVPVGRVLGERLRWLCDQLERRPVEEFLPGSLKPWGSPAQPLDGVIGAHLVERDYGDLASHEKRVVWQALAAANDFPRARALAEATGETPGQFALCVWMAGWYANQGEIERGAEMLLTAHGRWWPYAKWDALPHEIVLHPTLRLVATDRVRKHYLTRPIGPEAERSGPRPG
ncbi:hypothetical protein [Streptomyces sp. NPDC048612]|uniref:hypothetical protein n=1 Tax=Streptomyces sp. NPDC048612 TaxID=3365579 RepID=UPI00371902B3